MKKSYFLSFCLLFGSVCNLKAQPNVIAWGDRFQTNVPVALTNAVAIAAGYHHSVALKSDGTLISWGQGAAQNNLATKDISNVVAIAAGGSFSLALLSDGTVREWGTLASLPSMAYDVVSIAASSNTAFALRSDSVIVAW